jgi:hypothetical protein
MGVAFIDEKDRITRSLGSVAKGIEHYGSTAVPSEEKERAAATAPVGRARYNELKGPFLAKIQAEL